MLKRSLDVVCAGLGLAVFSIPLALLAVLIRKGSSGPAIFAQIRVGQNERPFVCYKLRTMQLNTGDRPSHEVSAASITPIGHVLRRTKLDELPQLWNVLKGELSLVGPRPCLPSQVELIEARRRLGVFQVRPGITGLAQIRGLDMSDPPALAVMDRAYIDQQSFFGDLGILVATVTGAGRGVDRVSNAKQTPP
jgi:O-antigen biosynthesis protein WbqP